MTTSKPTASSNTPHESQVLCDVNEQGVATLTLNRETKRNAFDDLMIRQLLHHLDTLANNSRVRCLVLTAKGRHFSAGADLKWMQSMAAKTQHENQSDAEQLAQLMSCFDRFPMPTIAVIRGCAFGGALGLIACADIALACSNATFCLSEVKLGLVPATIGPYMCRAIGARQARRYLLSAEKFDAETALSIGLIHSVSKDDQTLAAYQDELIDSFLANGPLALKQTKVLCLRCDAQSIDESLIQHTSKLIADVRVSNEAQQGLSAFFEKRLPPWAPVATQHKREKF